jgi:hypothetical protein
MDLKKIWCESVDWIHLAQCRSQWWDLCEHGNGSSGSIGGM